MQFASFPLRRPTKLPTPRGLRPHRGNACSAGFQAQAPCAGWPGRRRRASFPRRDSVALSIAATCHRHPHLCLERFELGGPDPFGSASSPRNIAPACARRSCGVASRYRSNNRRRRVPVTFYGRGQRRTMRPLAFPSPPLAGCRDHRLCLRCHRRVVREHHRAGLEQNRRR